MKKDRQSFSNEADGRIHLPERGPYPGDGTRYITHRSSDRSSELCGLNEVISVMSHH